jgi:hypothetical protein
MVKDANKNFIKVVAGAAAAAVAGEAAAAHFADCVDPCVRRETQVVLPDSESDQQAPRPERFRFTPNMTTSASALPMTMVSWEPHVAEIINLLRQGKFPTEK